MDKVASNEYIFEIDCEHTIKGIGGREVSIDYSLYFNIVLYIWATIIPTIYLLRI